MMDMDMKMRSSGYYNENQQPQQFQDQQNQQSAMQY